MGKCPMEEFYNQIRQWVNPTKHMGMLPEAVEKIIYAFVNKTSVDQVSKDQIHMVIHVICMGNAPSQSQVFAESTIYI
ncbi:hypothetical protein PHMEG_00032169 [Phytophthora megakarya]|uniref:Uncharacterized protein n=1 Tax=Phytophthora megakarya TaxID=4795 RepID=A0A225UW43_9STRA|nr:hypothetical protein PHMEG_00032169 [Phytophthora megakarya]